MVVNDMCLTVHGQDEPCVQERGAEQPNKVLQQPIVPGMSNGALGGLIINVRGAQTGSSMIPTDSAIVRPSFQLVGGHWYGQPTTQNNTRQFNGRAHMKHVLADDVQENSDPNRKCNVSKRMGPTNHTG